MTEAQTTTELMTQEELGKALGFAQDEIAGFLKAAAERDDAERQWENLFNGKDRIKLKLLTAGEEVLGLDDRLRAVIAEYNDKHPDDTVKLQDPNHPTQHNNKIIWQSGSKNESPSITKFLRNTTKVNSAEAWVLADDLEVAWLVEKTAKEKTKKSQEPASAPEPTTESTPSAKKTIPFAELEKNEKQAVDGMNWDDLEVVISRAPIDIAGMSTGRRWTSCMAKGREHHNFVPKEIAAGTLVAYLAHREDKNLRYPLMRVLLKPFRDENNDTILVPNHVYPKQHDVPGNSRARDALLHTVLEFVRPLHQGKTGTFQMDSSIYEDQQDTTLQLGAEALRDDALAKAITDSIPGKIREYITEIETAHKTKDAGQVAHYTKKLGQLYAEPKIATTPYLRGLRDMHMGQALPTPSDVLGAMGSNTVKNTLTKNEILSNIYLKGSEGWNRYMQQSHPTLTTLDLSSNNIGALGAQVFKGNTTLTTLNLANNNIGNPGATALAKNSTLTTLDLTGNSIGDEGSRALARNSSITTLDLSYNSIGDEGAEEFEHNTTLTTLDLKYNSIADEGANALSESTTLTTLDLMGNSIGAEGARALAKNSTLTTLNLRENNIGDAGAEQFEHNTTLTTLDLANNTISATGATALAKNSTLTTLDLTGNSIGDEGSRALARNSSITTLDLSYNSIGDEGAEEFEHNTTLTTLDLLHNSIGDEGAKALANNATLKALNLSENKIDDEGAKALAKNSTLTTLDLSDNNIGDEGAKALAKNTTLTRLHLTHNSISAEGSLALAKNTTFTTLNLSFNEFGGYAENYLYWSDAPPLDEANTEHLNTFLAGMRNNKNLLEYQGTGEAELVYHCKKNRKQANAYVQQLLTTTDVFLADAATKADIAARANAIMQVAEEDEKLSIEQKQNVKNAVKTVLASEAERSQNPWTSMVRSGQHQSPSITA
jgi:Ran GTPase-activating protein (RanGAP) involved in mRNA processing and transport